MTYTSSLSDQEWEIIEPLLPKKKRTKPPTWSKREILDGIFYQLKNGCKGKEPLLNIEVWSEDEHRIGLQSVLPRVSTAVGEQPIAGVKTQYKWLWLYGFVHPESGENKGVDFALH